MAKVKVVWDVQARNSLKKQIKLQEELGLSDRAHFRRSYLQPAIEQGSVFWIETTIFL